MLKIKKTIQQTINDNFPIYGIHLNTFEYFYGIFNVSPLASVDHFSQVLVVTNVMYVRQ